MKVLILGATGLVGQALWEDWRARPGWTVMGTAHTKAVPGMETLDIRDRAAIRDILSRLRPDVTVLAAANPYVDYCEVHPEETRAINVDGSIQVAEEAAAAGGSIVFLSSDYVFDGLHSPYAESDTVCPINEYGRQKVFAEEGIARVNPKHMILRISGVFGREAARKNFVFQVIDRIALKKPIQAATDLWYRPTYAPNVAPALAGLMESGAGGIFHAAGAEELSRYEFAQEIARAFELDPKWIQRTHLADLKGGAPRPPRTSLISNRLTPELSGRIWGVRRALQHMRQLEKAG